MQRDTAPEERVPGASRAPSPLFLGFLGALGLAAVLVFRDGFVSDAVVAYLVLAWIIATCVVVGYAVVLTWFARNAQRASSLAMLRPGCVVAPATRTVQLARAVHTVQSDVVLAPLGLTVLADDRGVELWGGSPEHPIRVLRAPWEQVASVDAAPVRRWGRAGAGLVVTIEHETGLVRIPVALVGGGLGGIFSPRHTQAERIAAALRSRRVESFSLS